MCSCGVKKVKQEGTRKPLWFWMLFFGTVCPSVSKLSSLGARAVFNHFNDDVGALLPRGSESCFSSRGKATTPWTVVASPPLQPTTSSYTWEISPSSVISHHTSAACLTMMRSILSFLTLASAAYSSLAYGESVNRWYVPILRWCGTSYQDTLPYTLGPSEISSNLFISLYSKLLLAPSFVPRSHGVVSPLPKNVVASQVYGSSSSRSNIKMMPIGVPKVAYRVPGSQQADWYDTLFYSSLL